jgi:hypothetical protein
MEKNCENETKLTFSNVICHSKVYVGSIDCTCLYIVSHARMIFHAHMLVITWLAKSASIFSKYTLWVMEHIEFEYIAYCRVLLAK